MPLLNATSALLLSPVPALDAQPQAEDIGKSTLVRDLIGSSITDPDAGDARGIAITGVAPGLELYTSTDNGTRWTKAPGLTAASALTLLADDNTRVLLVDPTAMNTTRPVSSGRTNSPMAPTAVVTTGMPVAMACMSACGTPSVA